MKNTKTKYLFWLAPVSGLVGLALRMWLESLRDAKGLLPDSHISITLLFLLTALTLGLLALCAHSVSPDGRFQKRFPGDLPGGVGNLAAAAGILFLSITDYRASGDFFRYLCLPVGILSALCLIWAAVYRFRRQTPPFFVYGVVTVYFMLDAVSQCRSWGTDPQLLDYFFPVLATVFLMLSAYHRTALTIDRGNYRWFVFISQAAAFFCCVCLSSESFPFYLAMVIWSAADFCNSQEA